MGEGFARADVKVLPLRVTNMAMETLRGCRLPSDHAGGGVVVSALILPFPLR